MRRDIAVDQPAHTAPMLVDVPESGEQSSRTMKVEAESTNGCVPTAPLPRSGPYLSPYFSVTP